MMYDLIIFDLDGTLLDTSQGIFNSVRYTEKYMGLSPINDEDLRKFVGPPPKEMYKEKYGLSEEMALEAAKKHREYGKTKAIYEAKLYPDVFDTLSILKNNGIKLAVATLKLKSIADEVLRFNNLYGFFDAIVGMDENESITKTETIIMAEKIIDSSGSVLMVGDSLYDYEGAIDANVDFLGVLYGFGFNVNKKYKFNTIKRFNDILKYVI